MEKPSETTASTKTSRKRFRKLAMVFILVFVAWRAWPAAAAFTGWNLKGAVVATPLSKYFLPPAHKPDEIRSGMAHPGFNPMKFAAQATFCPRSIRHGHAFWSNDPALPDAKATQLAEILASPDTYEPWFGEAACGGFHADWYLRWEDDYHGLHEVIICEGCHEALVYYYGGFIRCRLSKQGYEQILAITRSPE